MTHSTHGAGLDPLSYTQCLSSRRKISFIVLVALSSGERSAPPPNLQGSSTSSEGSAWFASSEHRMPIADEDMPRGVEMERRTEGRMCIWPLRLFLELFPKQIQSGRHSK